MIKEQSTAFQHVIYCAWKDYITLQLLNTEIIKIYNSRHYPFNYPIEVKEKLESTINEINFRINYLRQINLQPPNNGFQLLISCLWNDYDGLRALSELAWFVIEKSLFEKITNRIKYLYLKKMPYEQRQRGPIEIVYPAQTKSPGPILVPPMAETRINIPFIGQTQIGGPPWRGWFRN